MDYQKLVQETVDLRDAGKLEESRNLILDYLNHEPQNIEALHLLTDLLDDPSDKQAVLEQILKINPKNRAAQEKIKRIQLDTALNNAFEKAGEGNTAEALIIVDRVLTEDMRFPAAWYLKALYSKDPNEKKDALAELQKLSASNEDAKMYFDQLTSKTAKGVRKKRGIRTGYVFIIAAIILLIGGICGIIVTPLLFGNEEPISTEVGFDDPIESLAVEVETKTLVTCQEIIDKAMSLAKNVCESLGSNQACYGNRTVNADLVPEYTGRFDIVGDLVEVDKITRIEASPLVYEEQTWGIAFLKLQPDENFLGILPGQTVTFLVFGDTVLENNSQNMSTFYFTTGLTGIRCEQVDYNGLFVTAEGSQISFRSNGVDVVLQGDAILQAQPQGDMSVAMLSGSSELSSNGQSVSVMAGNYSTIPMSENLEPSGPISEPKPLSEELLELSCQLIGLGCPGNPITPVTATYTPTNTPTLVPTDTQVFIPPTRTPTKRPPTNTPPPTSPPPSGTCTDIKLVNIGPGQYRITNGYSSDIIITKIVLGWPVAENGNWKQTRLNNIAIHAKQLDVSPATAELFADTLKRTVFIGTSGTLELGFANPPAASGYQLRVEFDVGCARTITH